MNRYLFYYVITVRISVLAGTPNGVTVQQCLEEALATLLRQPVPVVGAGRTDAGVHARLMVAHFDWGEPVARPAFPGGEAEPFTSERYCRLPGSYRSGRKRMPVLTPLPVPINII